MKNKNILLGVLVVGVLSMTVAFAALSTRLNIGGTAQVASTTWNIHFQNWVDVTESTVTVGTNTQQNTVSRPTVPQLTQTINVENSTKVEGLNITLNQPNDYARYTFQIINEGTIDASLANFTHNMTCGNNGDCSHIDYNVACYDNASLTGTALTTNAVLLKNGGLAYCYLEVKYLNESNQNQNQAGSNQTYTKSAVTASLSANWSWVQRQGSAQTGGQAATSGQGNNEPTTPTTPVADSWDTYYYLDDYQTGTTSTFDNSWSFWGQVNSTKKQICGKFGGTTECFDYNSNGYTDCFHYNQQTYQTSVSGYIADVKSTMEGHNYNCTIYQDSMECKKTGTSISLNITKNSSISVFTSEDGYCETNDFGDIDCAY